MNCLPLQCFRRPVLSLVVILGCVSCRHPASVPPGEAGTGLSATVTPPAAATQAAAPEAYFAHLLDELLPKMNADALDDRRSAEQALQQACWDAGRPGAERERRALAGAIAARLTDDLAEAPRLWLIRQLEYIGRDEAVSALATQLGDGHAEAREWARRALQRNPSHLAGTALLTEYRRAGDPVWQLALLQAIVAGQAQDSIPDLVSAARGSNAALREMALLGLARLGAAEAHDLIATAMNEGAAESRRAATDAYLTLAAALAAKGRKAEALGMYRELSQAQGAVRCAAVIGMGRAGGVAELPALFSALEDPDPKVQGAAQASLALLPPKQVTAEITKRLAAASPQLKAMLLQALAENRNPDLLPVFLAEAQAGDEGSRIAAFEGMARLAAPGAAKALIREIAAPLSPASREAAENALAQVPGKGVSSAILKELKSASPAGRVELVQVLTTRRSPQLARCLRDLAVDDPDPGVRIEAVNGLAKVATADEVRALLRLLLAAPGDDERDAIRKALVAVTRRTPDRDRCTEPLLVALQDAAPEPRALLLRTLGPMGGPRALAAVRAAVQAPAEEVQDAAVRALADWPDGSALPDLLALTRTAPILTRRVLAARGYVRVVREASDLTDEAKLGHYTELMNAAPRAEEKKLALGGISELKSPAALAAAGSLLADPVLGEEAAAATIAIAEACRWSDPSPAKAALASVMASAVTEETRKKAQQLLADIEGHENHIRTWFLAGPYKEQGEKRDKLHDHVFAPEDASARESVSWRLVRTGDEPKESWFVCLDRLVGGNDAVAYLRTWFRAPAKQPARLEIGSDDGIKVWLNGAEIDNQNVDRALAPAQDSAQVELSAGWNQLLMKVSQAGGNWSACARVLDPSGGKATGLVFLDSPDAVDTVLADLSQEALVRDAARVAMDLVAAGEATPAKTKALYSKLVQSNAEPALKEQAGKRLAEIEANEDHVTDWQYAGPYLAEGKDASQLLATAFGPELAEAKAVSWRVVPVASDARQPWVVNLGELIGGDNRAAYLRVRAWSPAAQPVRLDVGSDDGVKVWVNGELVHTNDTARPLTPAQDKVNASLKEGANLVLLKITQGAGGWAACLRVRKPDGTHLDGLRYDLP